MKKSLMLGVFGLAAIVNSSMGQGLILLDNYNTGGPNVTYGSTGIPAKWIGRHFGSRGTGLQAGWTLGFYYVLGDVRSSIIPDPPGEGIPSVFGGGLILATGTGSTAAFFTSLLARQAKCWLPLHLQFRE